MNALRWAGMKTAPKQFYIHLVSDATGETLQGLARAVLAQFDNIDPVERFWPLVRSQKQLEHVIENVEAARGPVIFTLVDPAMRKILRQRCRDLRVPCVPVLDPFLKTISFWTGLSSQGVPGLQHALDDAYFHRMDAVDFALSFDDGGNLDGIEHADVILTGVSRTSKTPTCIFLARQGVMAANVPFVPGLPFPQKVLDLKGLDAPLVVGLTENPERLVALRRSRLKADEDVEGHQGNTYLDPEKVSAEILEARRFFTQQGWPVIDVTRRSVEETTAEIQLLLQQRRTGVKL